MNLILFWNKQDSSELIMKDKWVKMKKKLPKTKCKFLKLI